MALDLLSAALGLVILLLAGDALVKGAVNLALRLGVPALLVSMTIVAFGTSAPELLISIAAVLDDVPGLALGNVVGSNTANILLVLGVPAILAGLDTSQCDTRKTYIIMLVGTVLFIALAFMGPLTGWHGTILLSALALVLADALFEARRHRREASGTPAPDEDVEGADPSLAQWKVALFLVLGLLGLPLGADLLVDGAVGIAARMGVSDTVIGLTLVALGTSLPELATTVVAAFRRQADVALGNVIGSNMFNLLGIMGVTALVAPIPVDPSFLRFDFWVMLGASLLLAPFVLWHWRLNRAWGVALTAAYGAYILIVVS